MVSRFDSLGSNQMLLASLYGVCMLSPNMCGFPPHALVCKQSSVIVITSLFEVRL